MRPAQTCIGFASLRLQVERLEPRHALASMFVALGPMGGHAPHVGETTLDIVGGSLGRGAAYAPRAELVLFVVGRQLIATHAPAHPSPPPVLGSPSRLPPQLRRFIRLRPRWRAERAVSHGRPWDRRSPTIQAR